MLDADYDYRGYFGNVHKKMQGEQKKVDKLIFAVKIQP